MKSYLKPHQSIPEVWYAASENEGPHVIISGGIHGNEQPGIDTVFELLEQIEKIGGIVKGKVTLSLGNLKAIEQVTRSIHHRDLNKCFGENPIFDQHGHETYESQRAKELKQAWGDHADLLLDLHATIRPSKPFIVVPDLHKHSTMQWVIPYLGIQTVMTGQGFFPPNGEPIYTDTYVSRKLGGMGVTVEAGWMQNPGVKSLTENVRQVLTALGVLPGTVDKPKLEPQYYDAYWNVIAEEGFSFTKDWINFDKISANATFATTPHRALTVPEESIIIFPKPADKIVTGQEACIIAKKI